MAQTRERRREWLKEYRARNLEAVREKDRARKRRYGRPCLVCGKITDGSNGRSKAPTLCQAHSREAQSAELTIWTCEKIVAAIHLYAERYGRPPSAMCFEPALARRYGHPELADRFHADGDYPHVQSVKDRFGYWSDGLRAAGYEPNKSGRRRKAAA